MKNPSPLWNAKNTIYFLLLIYAAIGLFNLDRLPIAWNDEIQNLDPALVWHNTGFYRSPLWPNPGAELKFLSYPPLLEAWHCIWLYLGKSPFIVRLPFLIFHLITAVLLHRFVLQILAAPSTTKQPSKDYSQSVIQFIALLITALFLFDKSTGEIARSLRVETPILLLLMAFTTTAYRSFYQPNAFITLLLGLSLGSLAIAHLYTWPLVLIALLLNFNHLAQFKTTTALRHGFMFLASTLVPITIFGLTVKPELLDLKAQLFMQAEDHSGASIGANLYGFFIGRFIPYSLEQPYTFFLHLLYWVVALRLLLKNLVAKSNLWKTSLIPLLYLAFAVPTALFLTPQHRYYPVQHLLGLLVMAAYLQNFTPSFAWKPTNRWIKTALSLIFVVSLLTPWTIRNTAAILQRNQRNPHTAIQFLNKNLNAIPSGDLLGEPIANYWLAQSPHPKDWQYGFEFYPQHFPYNAQKPRYFVSRTTPKQLPFLFLIDSLNIPTRFAQSQKLGHTYNGLYLYQVKSLSAWKLLTNPSTLKITSGH
jgi:hypothetical protein